MWLSVYSTFRIHSMLFNHTINCKSLVLLSVTAFFLTACQFSDDSSPVPETSENNSPGVVLLTADTVNTIESEPESATAAATPAEGGTTNNTDSIETESAGSSSDASDTNVTQNFGAGNPVPPLTKSNTTAAIGTNIAEANDWSATVHYVDLFKSSRPFESTRGWGTSGDIIYDEDGWPINLNGGVAVTLFATEIAEAAMPMEGYIVLYDGAGKVEYGAGVSVVSSAPGRDVINISAQSHNHIKITQSDTNNPVKNIRIMMPGGICDNNPGIRVSDASACQGSKYLSFEEHGESIIFNPDFINYVKDFAVLRFMDYMQTNHSPVKSWNDRTRFEESTWFNTGTKSNPNKRGAPIEVMVELANRAQVDPWFCIPHAADDDYIRKFAEHVYANLDTNLKAHIEYSNEVWNGSFSQYDYALETGTQQGVGDGYSAQWNYYAKRSVEIFKIWEDVFGGNERLVRILGSQSVNSWLSDQILSYNDTAKHADALAIAPYFSPKHTEDLKSYSSVDDVFAGIDRHFSNDIDNMKKQAELANKHGLDLIAYEGGQHLAAWGTQTNDEHPNPLLYAANNDPRMGEYYQRYLSEWKNSGGKLFVHYSSPDRQSKWGSWGDKKHIAEPRQDAPKYDSILTFMENNPKWW